MSLPRAVAVALALLGLAAALPSAAEPLAKVPPTGVQTCLALDTKKDDWPTPQPCNGTGPLKLLPKQDGTLGVGPPAYEAVAGHPLTDCVRDRVSGLVWEGKPDSGQLQRIAAAMAAGQPGAEDLLDNYGPGNEPRPGSRVNTDAYSYHGDGRPGDALAYVAQVNAARLCGYTDWRLPTTAELFGIADVNTLMGADERAHRLARGLPAIDTRWFPHTVPRRHLTAEAADSTSMWCVDFKTASVYTCHRLMIRGAEPVFVRLVRGPQVPEGGRWREAVDERGLPGGVVEDRLTGLVWRRCAEPQTWNGRRCTWSAKRYDYVRAVQHAGAQPGWRLPTVKEMNSLVGRRLDGLDVPPADFPPTGAEPLRQGFWTSTVCNGSPQTDTARAAISAWVLSKEGNVYCESRLMERGMRLVRE